MSAESTLREAKREAGDAMHALVAAVRVVIAEDPLDTVSSAVELREALARWDAALARAADAVVSRGRRP